MQFIEYPGGWIYMKTASKRVDLLKVLMLVSILIMSSLAITLGTTGSDSGAGADGLSWAGPTGDIGDYGSRQASPMVESVPAATTLTTLVGEQEVTFDVSIQSLNTDDDDDTNGDNVLYDVVVDGTDAGVEADNLMRFNYNTRQFENVSSSVFSWVNKQVAPMGDDPNDYSLYAKGNGGDWKYVINLSNSFLDEDNDGTIDADEYWAINDGPKDFGDFEVNIKANAPPGYYRMKFKVTYMYQISNNINTSGLGSGAGATITVADLMTNEAMGPFQYYYWVPWDTAANSLPTDLDDLFMNRTAEFDFKKQVPYAHSTGPYNNVWEGLRDNGVDTPGSHPDLNGDSETRWLPWYPWAGGNPGFDLDQLYSGTIISNYPSPMVIQQRSLDQPKNFNAGNGTWMYTGNVTEDIDWGDPATHTEDVWFDFIINSTVVDEDDLNKDNETNDLKLQATDGDFFTGGSFEEFFINIDNKDATNEMTDVKATLILPTLSQGGFIFYKPEFETASVPELGPGENVDLKWRLSVDPQTPPGYYYGRLQLDYTKEFQTSDVDPLGNPLVRRVIAEENHFYVQFEVAFTPDLGDAKVSLQEPKLSVRAIPMPDTVIDTSTGKQLFNFTIKNTGNVKLYGADMMDGNLHMDFAEFKQMGDGYFDSDADPGIIFDPINVDEVDVGQEIIIENVGIQIPNHWYLREGIYRLYLNFTGYYYDAGQLGNESAFKYLEMNWIGADDDGMPRDCFVMIDEDGNEMIGDPGDSTRETEGMYTDIYIEAFDPTTKELAIIDWSPQKISQEVLQGGEYVFNVTFQNQQDYVMYDVWVEFDIEGYMDESYYYDWTNPVSRMNPKAYKDQLALNEEWTVNFTVDDLDKLLPEGEHHIPIKYKYNYEEYQGVEDMTTFSMIWDTGTAPFKPYIDTNGDFMLNTAGGTRAGNAMDIVFVMDVSTYGSTTEYYRTRDKINDFITNLQNNGVNHQMAVVGYNSDSFLIQDMTTDGSSIITAMNALNVLRATSNDGCYDAVVETCFNVLTTDGPISYRPGATRVVILVTDLYPNWGTYDSSDEQDFTAAISGKCMFFAIVDPSYYSYWDVATGATGGQIFNVDNGDYGPYFAQIATYLGSYAAGVTPAGIFVADLPLEVVADPVAVDLTTYGPYIIVDVLDTAFDIDTTVTSGNLMLGGRIRNYNFQVRLTNNEYVQYTDIEIELPLAAAGQTDELFINPKNATMNIEGNVPKTLGPNGAQITASFNVDINEGHDSGVFTFELQFKAMHDYTKEIVSGVIPVVVRVYPKQPILIIPQADPIKGKAGVTASIKPGEKFTLTFTLENLGGDDARDIYLTMSNDWYQNNPFTTIDAFVTSMSSHTTSYYNNGNLRNVSTIANTKLKDLGISSTTDIVDAERQLLAPTAVVPRVYIPIIEAGDTVEVSFRLKADSHMIPGRPYREWILLEYIDSDGLQYTYDETQQSLRTQPLPIIVYTQDDDDWPDDEEITSETLAVILIIIIIIIIILLFLGSVYQKRHAEVDEEEPRKYKYHNEPEEEEEEEEPEEEEPEEEEPIPEKLEEKPPEDEEEPDWSLDDDKEPEAVPEPEEEEEEEDDDDWAISEGEGKKAGAPPAKGKMPIKPKTKEPVKGKGPSKEAEDEEIDDWE
jgi:hypothetical protein